MQRAECEVQHGAFQLTPQSHSSTATTAPGQHCYGTTTFTFIQQYCNTTTLPLQYYCIIYNVSLYHHYNTSIVVLLQYQCNTTTDCYNTKIISLKFDYYITPKLLQSILQVNSPTTVLLQTLQRYYSTGTTLQLQYYYNDYHYSTITILFLQYYYILLLY